MNCKEQPFDLDIALANPDWVYLDDGRKVLEFAHLKLAGIIAATFAQVYLFAFFDETGKMQNNGLTPSRLILRIPSKKIKVTVFVWPDGLTACYSDIVSVRNSYFDNYCVLAEQGKCAKHEFEVEVNN